MGERCILGVDNVVDEEKYDQFDDLPQSSIGIKLGNYDIIERTTFVRSNIEGTYVD